MLCDLLSFTANIQSIDCKLDNFKKQHCLLMIKSIEHINTKLIMKTQSHTFSFKPYTFFSVFCNKRLFVTKVLIILIVLFTMQSCLTFE